MSGSTQNPRGSRMKQAILRALFTTYKTAISPVLHAAGVSRCLYLPTCSEYAYIALSRHGLLKGTALSVARIARCNPLAKGGHDPVPD